MVNQKLADLGIPNRFNLSSSRFSRLNRVEGRHPNAASLTPNPEHGSRLPFTPVFSAAC
jgi:hypothetical protein